MGTPVFKTYADLMRCYFPCHAFWDPAPDTILKPGSYGYVDRNGDWINLGNVRDEPMFGNIGKPKPDRNLGWGIRKSDSISSWTNAAGMSIGSVKPPKLPARFNVCLKYESKSDSGALLIPSEKLTNWSWGGSVNELFRQWAYRSAREIRQRDEDVGIHGFFVVSKTYATPEVWTAAFQSQQTGGNVTFSADVYEVAGASLGTKWPEVRSRIPISEDQQSYVQPPTNADEIAEQDAIARGIDDGVQSYVVAIDGTYFWYSKWRKVRNIPNPLTGKRMHWFREPEKSSDALLKSMQAAKMAPPADWKSKPIETITNGQFSQLLDDGDKETEDVFYGLEDSEGKVVKEEKVKNNNWKVPDGYFLVEYRLCYAHMTETPVPQQVPPRWEEEGGVLA
ncbi:hypothetical protein MHUMG1_09454 [Metarhizium humberi]|uniref:Uncharacterized protein n=1 Tax=Metarhizium humberi TaxID=2596975 RepID=A0A9P8M4L6_9HYPO|nr:hypothetical protein MHUMG1_09454 [Metarhizium humberi]